MPESPSETYARFCEYLARAVNEQIEYQTIVDLVIKIRDDGCMKPSAQAQKLLIDLVTGKLVERPAAPTTVTTNVHNVMSKQDAEKILADAGYVRKPGVLADQQPSE
jgi:hypothetical protein